MMQEQERDIEAESPLSLELRQHGTTQTIAVSGLELGPFVLDCELEPLVQDLEDHDLSVILRGSSTRLRSLELRVRYDALRQLILSRLNSHRAINRVRVIADGHGLGVMGVWSDSDTRAPFGLRLDLVAGFDSEIDIVVSRVALFGQASISPIDLALLVSDRLALGQLFEPMGPQVYHGSPLATVLRQAAPVYGWKVPQWHDCRLSSYSLTGEEWTVSFSSGLDFQRDEDRFPPTHPDALYTLDQTLRHRDVELELLSKGGDEVKQFYADRLFDGETSRWVAERAFQCAITDTELQAKLLDSAERWLIKDERLLAARMLLVHASLAQKHPEMAERLLFELAELPTQTRIHRRMGAAELYGLRLAIAQVATEVDPVHAREHYERVLSQNPDSVLAYESLARLSARLDEPRAAVEYGQSYLVHETDEAAKFEFLLFLGQEYLKLDDGDEEAARAYRQALHLRPDDRRVLTALADLALERSDTSSALRHLSRLSNTVADDVEPEEHVELLLKIAGLWEVSLGDESQAIDYLREAWQTQPLNPRVVWPLVQLLRKRDEYTQAESLVLGLADSRVEDFEVPKAAILEANHWLLKHAELSNSDVLLRLEHLHATDPDDLNLSERLWDALLERELETRAVHLATDVADREQGTTRANWLFRAAELEVHTLKRLERAADLCSVLLSQHSEHRATYPLVLESDMTLANEVMIAAYQNLKDLEFNATFASHWASTIAESLNDEAAWNWWVIAATNEPRPSVVEELVRLAELNSETEKLAIAYEARAIERGDDIDEWLKVAGLWEELSEGERILEVLTLGVSANPGNERLTLRLASVLHGTFGPTRAWEVLNEALRHLEHDSEAAFKIFRGAGHYAQLDNRPEAEAEALYALARAKAATQDEISRLTGLLESLGRYEDLALVYEELSGSDAASPTSRRQDRLRAARAYRACGQVERAVEVFLLLMSEESDLSLEAARQLEPLARELGEHARHERSLEYQILHETGTKRIRALEELLALHIATRPREQAKLSAERLLQADTSSPKGHFYLAESARQDAGFEETLHHLSSLLFARGRERGLSESLLEKLYVEAISLADVFEPRLSERLRADYSLEFPSRELAAVDLIQEHRDLGDWPIVESFLKARQAWSTGAERDALVIERSELLLHKLDRSDDALSLLERSLNLDEIPDNAIWDALKATLLSQNRAGDAYEKAVGYMDHVLHQEHAYRWAIEAVNVAGRYASLKADGEALLRSIKELVPDSLRVDYRSQLRNFALLDTLRDELQNSLDKNWRIDDGRFKELITLLSESDQPVSATEELAERAVSDFPYLDQGFQVLESLRRDERDVGGLFELYERWTEAREGDDRYQLIRKTVELGDEQGDIRRSFSALRPAVDLVENPVPILEELYTRATQLEDLSSARDLLDELTLAVIEPVKKREVWSRLFELATGPLDSVTDARRSFEGLGSPLSRLEPFAAQLSRHQRFPEVARTIELVLEGLGEASASAEALGPILFYLVSSDGANFDEISTRVVELSWEVESKIARFRAWMHESGRESVAIYLGLHILSRHSEALGVQGVSEALEALVVQHDAPVWMRQRLTQFRPDSFRLAVSIFDAMWPEESEGALYWLSRATDICSDAQMFKLLESRRRSLSLEVDGVRWLRDRQDLLGLELHDWVDLAEYAEKAGNVAATVECWLTTLPMASELNSEQAFHVVELAIDGLQDFELAGRVVEECRFEPRVLEYLVSKYIQDGDIDSAIHWLGRAERHTGETELQDTYRKQRMFLSLRDLDDYDSALMIADDAGDDGELLVALADALAASEDSRAVHPYETAIDRAQDRSTVSQRCAKLFKFALEQQLDEHIQFALVHTFEAGSFFEALTDKALEQGNKRAAFEWLLEWGKNTTEEKAQEELYLRALELALHQCDDIHLARKVLGYTRNRASYVDKIVQYYIAKQDYLEAVNELERASDLTSDTRLIQAWLEHAVDLSLNRLDDLDGAKALAEMAPEPLALLERTLSTAFAKGRESLGLEIARELIDSAPERDARDRSLRLLLDYVDDPQEIREALGRLSNPTTHEKRRLVELLLTQSEYDALTTMSHWGEVVDARTIVGIADLLSQHGELEAALRWLEPLLEIHPPHREAWESLERSAQTPAFEASIGAAYLRWVDRWSADDPSMFRALGWTHLLRAGRRDQLPETHEIETELDSLAPQTLSEWQALLDLAVLINANGRIHEAVDGVISKSTYGEPMWLMAHEKGHQLAVSESDDAAALQFSKALCEAQPGRLDYSEWYTQALRKMGAWSELQLFMEEQLESGLSDATTARGLIAESLFETGDDESGLEVLLRVEPQDRDRTWATLVWDKSAALGRSESAYEAAKLFADWESGSAKADWLRTAARIALWDLGWIDEGRKGLELAHAIHHEPLETNLNELASLDETLRVRRYRELTWVWSAPDDVPLLNHWFDWALLTEHETLPEIVELCRSTDMLTDARWLGLLSSETVFSEAERRQALKDFVYERPQSYRDIAPLLRTLFETDAYIDTLGEIETRLQQEPQLRADILFDLAYLYEATFNDQAKALGLYIQGVELSPRLDQQMKVAELSYELGYFARTVEISRVILPQLDESSSVGIRLAKMAFESALELQEERDIERVGDYLLKSRIMTLEAFDAWMTYLTPSWLSGRLSLCIAWINDLEADEALRAILVARGSISATAPDLWKNLVESQAARLADQPEYQVLRLPWLERSERLQIQTPLLFQRPDLFESSEIDDLLFESAAWSMEVGLTKQFDLLTEYAEISEPRWMRLLLNTYQQRDDELGAALLCLERMQVVKDEPLMRRLEAQLGHRANRLMLKGNVEEIVVLYEALMDSQHFLFTERLSREVAWFLKHHSDSSSSNLDDLYWAEVTSNNEMLHRIANKRLDEAFESLDYDDVDDALALAERLGRREDISALVMELARRNPENRTIFLRAITVLTGVEDAFRFDEFLREFDELNPVFVTEAECLSCGDALKRLGFDLEASFWYERALENAVVLSRRDGARLIETLLEKNPESPRVRALIRDASQPPKLREYALERLMGLITDPAALAECEELHVELTPNGRVAMRRKWNAALESGSYSDILCTGQQVFSELDEPEQSRGLAILDSLLADTDSPESWDVDFESWYGAAASTARIIDWCAGPRGKRLEQWLEKTWAPQVEDLLDEAAGLGIHAETSVLRWALTLDLNDELWTSYGSRLLALAPESLVWGEFERLASTLAERGDQFGAVQALESAIEELDEIQAIQALIALIGDDEELSGRVLELRQERSRRGYGIDADYLALGRDAASRGASQEVVSQFESISDRTILREEDVRQWAQAYEKLERSQDAVELWETIGGNEVVEAKERMRLELAEASGDRNAVVGALVARVDDQSVSDVERLEAAHRLRDLAAELEDFRALQASLEFLESQLQGDELESVREERIMSAESEGEFELAATVLQRVFESADSSERSLVAERLETLLRIDVGDDARADLFIIQCAQDETFALEDWKRSLGAADRQRDFDGWLNIARRYGDDTLEPTELLRWAQFEKSRGDKSEASRLYREVLKTPELFPLHVDDARNLAEELGEREQMRAYDWTLVNQSTEDVAISELLSFLETWYLEDGPLVDEAVDRLQSSVEEELRRTGESLVATPDGYSRAAWAYRELTRRMPTNLDDSRTVARLAGNSGNIELAYIHYRHIAGLLPSDAEAGRYVGQCGVSRPSFSRGLSPEEEALVEVSSPHLDWYWELMTGVNEVIAEENSDLERSFGIDAERDLLEPTDPRVQTVAAALEWFGLASIEVYRWRGGGYRCVVQPGDTTRVMLGSTLATDAEDGELFVATLYSAALSASGVQWCLGLDSNALETALQGLVHAVAGEQPLMTLSEEALRRSAEYKRAIPQMILSGLEESVESFINRHSQLGYQEALRALRSRALRFALVVSGGDLESTVTAFMRLSDLDGWESEERRDALGLAPELDALEEFHVSWEHTALRRELGFAFGRSIDS